MRGKIFKQDLQMFAFFGFLLIPILYLSYLNTLGSQWKINSMLLFLILAGMLLFSATEIPIYRTRTRKPEFSDDEIQLLGEYYSVPLDEEFQGGDRLIFNTSITLNIGGFILPLVLAAYAIYHNPSFAILEIGLIIIVITHLLTEIKPAIGILIPDYIGLLTIPFAMILDPGNAATVVLGAGVLGILITMVLSLLNINENSEGSAFINLGGVGNFRAIYITVLLAALLTYVPV